MELVAQHPDWTVKQLADELGVTTARIYQIAPRGRNRAVVPSERFGGFPRRSPGNHDSC